MMDDGKQKKKSKIQFLSIHFQQKKRSKTFETKRYVHVFHSIKKICLYVRFKKYMRKKFHCIREKREFPIEASFDRDLSQSQVLTKLFTRILFTQHRYFFNFRT